MNKSDVLHHKVRPSEVSLSDGSKFFGSVFLYVFIALAISALVSLGSGALLRLNTELGDQIYVIGFIVSLVLYIPMLIWARIAISRNGKTMVPAFVCYSITTGLLVSPLVIIADFYSVALSFGITCLTFGILALIAWKAKKSISTIGLVAGGLFFGALILIGVNLLLSLFVADQTVMMFNWIISTIVLVATLLITIVDINKVKRLAENGVTAQNVALECALDLYVDFIYIFIRILALIVRLRGK